jgi:hypothetical protein
MHSFTHMASVPNLEICDRAAYHSPVLKGPHINVDYGFFDKTPPSRVNEQQILQTEDFFGRTAGLFGANGCLLPVMAPHLENAMEGLTNTHGTRKCIAGVCSSTAGRSSSTEITVVPNISWPHPCRSPWTNIMKGISVAARYGFLHMRLSNLICGAAGKANIRKDFQSARRAKCVIISMTETRKRAYVTLLYGVLLSGLLTFQVSM